MPYLSVSSLLLPRMTARRVESLQRGDADAALQFQLRSDRARPGNEMHLMKAPTAEYFLYR